MNQLLHSALRSVIFLSPQIEMEQLHQGRHWWAAILEGLVMGCHGKFQLHFGRAIEAELQSDKSPGLQAPCCIVHPHRPILNISYHSDWSVTDVLWIIMKRWNCAARQALLDARKGRWNQVITRSLVSKTRLTARPFFPSPLFPIPKRPRYFTRL